MITDMITCIWLHIYEYTHMITCIWLHVYDYIHMITCIWLHTYEYFLLIYDTHIWAFKYSLMVKLEYRMSAVHMIIYRRIWLSRIWFNVRIWYSYMSMHVYDTHIWVPFPLGWQDPIQTSSKLDGTRYQPGYLSNCLSNGDERPKNGS